VFIPYTIYSESPGYVGHLEFGRHLKNFENLFLAVDFHVQEADPALQVFKGLIIPPQQTPLIGSTFPPAGPVEQKSYPPFKQFRQLPFKLEI
jgi:hypothetical protein